MPPRRTKTRIPFKKIPAGSLIGRPKDEQDDCAVIAVALATGTTYPVAYSLLASLGRKPRGAFYVFTDSMKSLGFSLVKNLCWEKLESAMQAMEKGRFVVALKTHAFAVVDGVVFDWCRPKPKSRVRVAFQYLPSNKESKSLCR